MSEEYYSPMGLPVGLEKILDVRWIEIVKLCCAGVHLVNELFSLALNVFLEISIRTEFNNNKQLL